jgi:hypothetical protein
MEHIDVIVLVVIRVQIVITVREKERLLFYHFENL